MSTPTPFIAMCITRCFLGNFAVKGVGVNPTYLYVGICWGYGVENTARQTHKQGLGIKTNLA